MELPSAGREFRSGRPKATVVISTRDRPVPLRRCLEAVRKTLGPDDEIIVVDSASLDRTIVAEIAISAGAKAYRCEEPGASRARNVAIGHASGEIIAFTDDDVLVDKGWLEALISPFADPNVGAVVGPIFQSGTDPLKLLTRHASFNAAHERAVFRNCDAGWFERIRFGAIGSGANFAARRELFDRNGRFRECLGAGAPIPGDETFFFFSIVANGETIINEPSARVFHPEFLDDRFRQIRQSRVAYWVYAILNFPQLIPQIPRSLTERATRNRVRVPEKTDHPPTGLLRAILCTPRLLFSAWRFSRLK